MTATITQDQWVAVRDAVAGAGERFAELLLAVRDPQAMATPHWTIADTAAHTASVAWMDASLVAGEESLFPVPALQGQVDATTVDTVADLNVAVMGEHYTDRDLPVLAERLRADLRLVLERSEGLDPMKPLRWLGSSAVPLAGLLAHLLNEILVHGRDIAQAAGLRWEVPSSETALFFELFVLKLADYGAGHLLDNDEPPSERRIAVEFRSRFTTPVTLVLQHGKLVQEEPGGPTDIKISFDPTALDLMMFGRISQLSAVLTGKVLVWGRRPWLLPTFLKTVRMPS